MDKWRFYGLSETQYRRSLEREFAYNISSLLKTNAAIAVLFIGFLFVPIYLDKNLTKASFYVGSGAIAAFLYFFVSYKYRVKDKEQKFNKKLVYTLIFLSYVNVISFGIYLGVWANPGHIAGSFLAILIFALLLFNIPPLFYACLTILSTVTFIVIVINVKSPLHCNIDIPNALFAGAVSLNFGWQIIRNRLFWASLAEKIENERDSYFNQSTVDELTQLKNRRDFMNSFQRALTNHRQNDNYLCVAILDVDYFKNYNDHYGHPKGDECLRTVGKALKNLQNKLNIYAARIGGEEFALIWFEKDAINIQNIATIVNNAIYDLNIPHEKSDAAPYVTVSIGIHVTLCGASNDINTLYNSADKALYAAKRNGRNRAVISFNDHLQIEALRKTA